MTTTVNTSQSNGAELTWASANFPWTGYPANNDTWADDFARNYAVSAGETVKVAPNGLVRSLAFGAGNYVDVPGTSGLNTPNAFTVELWAYLNAFGGNVDVPMIAKSATGDFSGAGDWEFGYGWGADIYFWTHAGVASTAFDGRNGWHHMAAVYDGVNLSIYIDGVLFTRQAASAGTIGTNSQDLWVGRAVRAGYFLGNLRNVRVFNRALAQSEIQQRVNGFEISRSGLVYELVGNAIDNGQVHDNSGNNNTGTIQGSVTLSPAPAAGDPEQNMHDQHAMSDAWATAENRASRVTKSLTEAWATAESVAKTFKLSKSEAWATAEALAKLVKKPVSEVWSTADALVKNYRQGIHENVGVASDAFADQADFHPQFSESVSFAEKLALSYGLSKAEAAHFADAIRQAYTHAEYNTLHMAEQLDNTVEWERAFSEAFATAEAFTKDYGLAAHESVATLEAFHFGYTQALAEGFTTTDALSHAMTWQRGFAEAFQTVEASGRNFTRPMTEAFQTLEALAKHHTQHSLESFQTSENWNRVVAFHAAWQEAYHFAEQLGKFFTKPQAEAFATVDALKRTYNLAPHETVNLAEQLVNGLTYIRNWAEQFQTVDHEAIVWNHLMQLAEAVNLYEEYRRNPNAVLSDIRLGTTEITFDQFKQLLDTSGAVGFEDFHTAIAGDYQYTKALFKAVVDSISADRPQINSLGVTVDMPDIFDRGTATTQTTKITVNYNRTFFVVPELSVRQTGGTGVADIQISNETKTSFDVLLVDANNNGVAGSISWMAHGY